MQRIIIIVEIKWTPKDLDKKNQQGKGYGWKRDSPIQV